MTPYENAKPDIIKVAVFMHLANFIKLAFVTTFSLSILNNSYPLILFLFCNLNFGVQC